MAKIVVTGGAGFIGSHLCDALLHQGHDVIALDNFDPFYDPEIKRRNLRDAMAHDRFSLVEADILDSEALAAHIDASTDVVVHLAARAGVRPSIADPRGYERVNICGTVEILEACRRVPGCRLIFASSSSVYGNRKDGPFKETDPVDDPISPYAATKKAGELLCYTYHHLYGFPVTCLRFFTVYGPRQRPDLAIHKFARLIEDGRPIPVYGDGSMKRDFTYIDDIIGGVLGAFERKEGYRIYNLGESRPVSVAGLVAALETALGRKAAIDHQPVPPGDVEQTFADVDRARAELGYKPATDLETGLARFVSWLREGVSSRG